MYTKKWLSKGRYLQTKTKSYNFYGEIQQLFTINQLYSSLQLIDMYLLFHLEHLLRVAILMTCQWKYTKAGNSYPCLKVGHAASSVHQLENELLYCNERQYTNEKLSFLLCKSVIQHNNHRLPTVIVQGTCSQLDTQPYNIITGICLQLCQKGIWVLFQRNIIIRLFNNRSVSKLQTPFTT